jgi:hypothetical protein
VERERLGFRARMTDHLAVAAGTEQGLFIISDGIPDGPYFKGSEVAAFLQTDRGYLVATINRATDAALWLSDDDGQSWNDPVVPLLAFPDDTGAKLVRICQIQVDAGASGPDSKHPVLAGVEPAALFRSVDGGTFELVRGLWDHPDRPVWGDGPGNVVDTVLTHPDRPGRIIVAIESGGVYRSDDSGETWQARNSGMATRSGEDASGARRHVYKLALDAASPDALFAQTDSGTYRSENAGDSWTTVGRSGEPDGLTSDYGFPVVAHPTEPGTAFVFPLESESYPCSPGGRPRVYRTTDGGGHWAVLGDGLPYENAYVTVLREAFTIGQSSPYALVLGTKSGQIFASVDHGDRWRLVASGLPPVLCVRVLD